MTLFACVPAPGWVVLGPRAIVAEGLPLVMVSSRVVIGATALERFPRDRNWTVLGFAQAFARAVTDAPLRAVVAGIGPEEKVAGAFEVVITAGRAPSVTRIFDPYLSVPGLAELPSFPAIKETLDSAVTLRKNPPARKVARLVSKLVVEAGGAGDVVIVAREGVTRVTDGHQSAGA